MVIIWGQLCECCSVGNHGGNASEYDVVVVTFVLTLKLIEQNSLREKLKYMNKMKLESKILILDMYKRFLFICFLYYYNTP